MSSRQTFTSEVILNALEKTDNHPTAATNCNVDESGNFQKPLKMTSLKQIYLQIEKKYIYKITLTLKRSHTSLSDALIKE